MFGPSVRNGFRVPPKKIVEIRAHALRARSVFGLSPGTFFSMGPFLEQLRDFAITLDVVEDDELPSGVEACCIPEQGTLVLNLSTYSAACADEGRSRFTVIHEIGHIALAHARTFHRDSGGQIAAFEDSEWQANTFAAEFLMPADDLVRRGIFAAPRIMLEYGVSFQAADYRLKALRKQGLIH